jgi:aryl-alcohol dehydrogenase-like predicted oxidoreductase
MERRMRTIHVPALDRAVSSLGFGCASLGSRVSPGRGRTALEQAFDVGVTWYDVAPSYGDGHAETILGEFSAGRREAIVIATKVGILPPTPSFVAGIVKPILRKLTTAVPQARKLVAHLRPPATKTRITAELIETSIAASLHRLKTDHVDVLALHEPSLEEISDSAVLTALEKARARGQTLTLSVAGHFDVAVQALRTSDLFSFVQIRNSPFSRDVEQLRAAVPADRVTTVTFGVFGHDGPLERLIACLDDDPNLVEDFRAAGFRQKTAGEMACAYLLAYAFMSNEKGVTLASMYKAGHLDLNAGYAAKAIFPETLSLAARLA